MKHAENSRFKDIFLNKFMWRTKAHICFVYQNPGGKQQMQIRVIHLRFNKKTISKDMGRQKENH